MAPRLTRSSRESHIEALLEPRQRAASAAREGELARAFDALPGELKVVVGLRYQEQCTFAEIAAILDVSEEHVQAVYARALSQLPALS
jgi:RNA polymerase sigma factor (sigma-70 family)